jgi:hypothetical protein
MTRIKADQLFGKTMRREAPPDQAAGADFTFASAANLKFLSVLL